jgi:hypothetical protein
MKRISRRAICSSVVVRDRRRRGEVAPADFYCYFEEGVSGRAALAESGFITPAVFYSHIAQRGCSALREILLLEEIQG